MNYFDDARRKTINIFHQTATKMAEDEEEDDEDFDDNKSNTGSEENNDDKDDYCSQVKTNYNRRPQQVRRPK